MYFNGIAFQLNALIDCGVNGYAFIDQKKAKELQRKIHCPTERLVRTIPVTSFDRNQAKGIQQVIQANLYIDGRVIMQCPFLELDINQYDIILERRWLAYYDVMPDCRRWRLIWPEDRGRDPKLKVIIIAPEIIPDPQYQKDMEARQRKFEKNA